MIFFGLKSGQDLEKRAAHPHQEFPGVSPPGTGGIIIKGCSKSSCFGCKINFSLQDQVKHLRKMDSLVKQIIAFHIAS